MIVTRNGQQTHSMYAAEWNCTVLDGIDSSVGYLYYFVQEYERCLEMEQIREW